MTSGLYPTWQLRVARTAWVVLTLVLFGLLVASVPPYVRQLASAPTSNRVQDPATMLALLVELGLSPHLYAVYQVAWRAVVFLPYLLIGLLLFLRRPDSWRALGIAFLFSFGGTLGGSITVPPGQPQSAGQALALLLSVMGSMTTPLLFYVFPDGRFVPRWTRWLALATFPVMLLNAFFPGTRLDPFEYPALSAVYGVVAIGSFLVAPAYRYFRAADATQRQQLKWALLGLLASPLIWVITGLTTAVFPAAGRPDVNGLRFQLAYMAWSTPLYLLAPLGIGLAVLRYRLWDIDVIIRRTLIYSTLTAVLAGAYLGSVLVLQGIFQAVTGEGRNELVTVLSTLAIAALVVPLRGRVQAAIDRRFYRKKYDAARTLAAFGAQARDVVELDELQARLLSVVDETMQPAHADLWLQESKQP